MIAGRMRSKIRAWEPVPQGEIYGEPDDQWIDRGLWYAERTMISGHRSEEVDEHFADYRVKYNTRIQHHVEPGWEIDGDDGQRYTVVAVEPYAWLGMQTIVCDRLNT